MKRLSIFLFSLCLIILSSAVNPVRAQQTFATTSETVIGVLQYLPKDYASNSNKYPLVIFLHGIGERGANSTNPSTLESTIYSVDNLGPPMFAKNGYQFPFIMVSPQLKNNYGSWPTWYVLEVINWAKNKFRVDEKRIHITGLSLGGGGVFSMMENYPQLFASAAPLCASWNTPSKACNVAKENLATWAFHGDADTTVPLSRTANMINAINACYPAPNPRAKLTIYGGMRHNVWDRAYKTDHTYHSPNLYEWMVAQYNKKNGSNWLPTANAGADKSYSSASSISVSGSASDPDGSIASYRWTKIGGPSSTISNSTSASMSASVSSAGTYIYKLTVTDNAGGVDTDFVKVVVGSSSSGSTGPNAAPVAKAPSDVTITLPTNSVSLQASATDSDGSISSWSWAKLQGPSASLSGTTSSRLVASGMAAGTYIFRVTVRDNDGATDIDDVQVIVRSSTTSTTNKAPVAKAPSDVTITLPTNSVSLQASATDSDGSISSWSWLKLQGPSASLSGTTSSRLVVSGMAAGTYIFRVTVKDNKGATDIDDVQVIVRSSTTTNKPPVVTAAADFSMKLPSSTAYCKSTSSDSDGSIVYRQWVKLSGPSCEMSNTTSPTLTAWRMTAGTYIFRVTVKDNKGASDYDDIKVVVYN